MILVEKGDYQSFRLALWLSGLRQCDLVPGDGTCTGLDPHGRRNFLMEFDQCLVPPVPIQHREESGETQSVAVKKTNLMAGGPDVLTTSLTFTYCMMNHLHVLKDNLTTCLPFNGGLTFTKHLNIFYVIM